MNSSTSSTITAKISRRSSPRPEAAEPLGERVQDEDGRYRAVDRGDAAEDSPDHHLERQGDLERGRARDAQVMREQRARKARRRGRDGEREQLVARRVDAGGARRHFIVADRMQHQAELGVREPP